METGLSLTKTRIQAGVWEGVLQAADGKPLGERVPEVVVTHLEQPLHSVAVTEIEEQPGHYLVRVAIPPDQLSDGVQTFLISEKVTGARLASFTVITGEPLEDDIRAELDLLRAELDMLKKAFRRHCVETA